MAIFYPQNLPPYKETGLVTSMQQPCVRIPERIQVDGLKADNVLLTATGDIKLADFGLAREFIPVKQFVMEYGVDGSSTMSFSKLHRFKGWLATLGGSRIFPPSVQQESRCFFAWHFNFRNPCARFYHI